MQKIIFQIGLFLAFKSIGRKKPRSFEVFHSDDPRPPLGEEAATHVVIGAESITRHVVFVDRTPLYYKVEHSTLRDLLRACVEESISETAQLVLFQLNGELYKQGRCPDVFENADTLKNIRVGLEDRLHNYLTSWHFKLLERHSGFRCGLNC